MTADPTARTSGRAWARLLVLCGTIFLEGSDVAMLAVAVPTIRADPGLSTGTAAWVMSGYVLGYAGFTLLGGRVADLLGRRRMFLTWLGVFLVFSMLGGFATDGWMLVVARFATGVAAAFMTPAAMSIITTSYPEGPQRDKALLVFAGVGAGGFSLGPVVGGLLTELGWRRPPRRTGRGGLVLPGGVLPCVHGLRIHDRPRRCVRDRWPSLDAPAREHGRMGGVPGARRVRPPLGQDRHTAYRQGRRGTGPGRLRAGA